MTNKRKKRLLLSLFRAFSDKVLAVNYRNREDWSIQPSDIKDVILFPKKYRKTDGFATIVFDEQSKNVAHLLKIVNAHYQYTRDDVVHSFASWLSPRHFSDNCDRLRYSVIIGGINDSHFSSFFEYVKHLFCYFTDNETKVESLEDIELQLVLMGRLEPQ